MLGKQKRWFKKRDSFLFSSEEFIAIAILRLVEMEKAVAEGEIQWSMKFVFIQQCLNI